MLSAFFSLVVNCCFGYATGPSQVCGGHKSGKNLAENQFNSNGEGTVLTPIPDISGFAGNRVGKAVQFPPDMPWAPMLPSV